MSEVPVGITVSGTLQRQAWIDRVLPPVEMVRPGLWSIPTPFPDNPLRYVVTYAVAHACGLALIDTGWPCQEAWDGLQAGLREAGWDIGDINAVLVTHGHGDHMGLARRIRERTGAWVAMHEADSHTPGEFGVPGSYERASDDWLRRRGGLTEDFVQVLAPSPVDIEDLVLVPDRFLEDGGRPLGADSGMVSIWTPGHTPGHVCFFDSERNVLLTGDHILPRISPNISPSPFETADILGTYLQSLLTVADVGAEEVLPAHEYRFIGLKERVLGLRQHHEVRLGEVLSALHATPGSSTVEVASALHWSRPWDQMLGLQRRFAIGEAYSHLIHLDRTAYVTNKGVEVDAWHALRDSGPKLG